MSPDYNVTPFKSSEQGPSGGYNLPPVLRFADNGPSFQVRRRRSPRPFARYASVGVPMTLDLLADDDAQYTSGTNAPMSNSPPPVTLTLSKYRGPGAVTFCASRSRS